MMKDRRVEGRPIRREVADLFYLLASSSRVNARADIADTGCVLGRRHIDEGFAKTLE